MKQKLGWALLWLNTIPAALFRSHEQIARRWCASVLPQIRTALASAAAKLPFPVCNLLPVVLLLIALSCVIWKRRCLLPYFAAALALLVSFTWVAPCALSEEIPPASAADLYTLCLRLSREADQLAAQSRPFDRHEAVNQAMLLCGSNITPKPAAFPELMKKLGIAGWWSPLTSEAVVDLSMNELNLPFTLCHELAHAQGIAGEAQANHAAYLSCMQGGDTFRYSGTMNALWYAMRALRAEDASLWNAAVGRMSDAVLADFCRMNGFNEAPAGPLDRIADAINGFYMRLMNIEPYESFPALLIASEIS